MTNPFLNRHLIDISLSIIYNLTKSFYKGWMRMWKNSKYLRFVIVLLTSVIFLAVFNIVASAEIIMQPYLQGIAGDGAYILVESDSMDTVTVNYGTTIAYGYNAIDEEVNETEASTFVHHIKLTGLQPDSLYHYKAVQGNYGSDDFTLTTPARVGSDFRFAYFADNRTNSNIFDKILTQIQADQPRFLMIGGDMSESPKYKNIKTEFFRSGLLNMISYIPFYSAEGNHDAGDAKNSVAFTHMPENSGPDGSYSFDYGDLHTLVINTESDCTVGSKQYNFAQDDLFKTQRIWKVVVFHQSAYVYGTGHQPNQDMVKMTSNIFEPNGVDMVLTGHSHFFQHNLVNGIPHMVIGSSGAPLYTPKAGEYTVKYKKSYCYGVADVSPTQLNLQVKDENGDLLDTITLNKAVQKPIKVILNGKELSADVAPIMIGNRVMMPVRAFFNAIGGTVDWNDSTKTVTGKQGSTTISLTIDKNIAGVNGQNVKLDVPATIYEGRTFVPVRFIAESLHASVSWDGDNRTVNIQAATSNVSQSSTSSNNNFAQNIKMLFSFIGKSITKFIRFIFHIG